ncbi:MAG: DNA (cytosine-5-)-methyltransferase [Defluviitaleaceae bacterium]|nr:DNA (cytosine-5-)-methyltransferase [Defluviitaleaceae bacterium]
MQKFIDLFCGIGGFRLALESCGLHCVFSSEIDNHAKAAYQANFGELPSGDITQIAAQNIPKHDILCAGFPCQSFSISGKRGGISDNRGRLFYEIVRIAKFHKPSVLLLENVKNILTIDNGLVAQEITASLNEIGYNVEKYVLNASFFGVPQARERVYFVALKKEISVKYTPPQATMQNIFLEDILEEVDENFILQRDDIKISEQPVKNKLKPIRIGTVNKGGQGERIYSPKGHAITQSAYGGGVGARTGLYKTAQGVRRLTINECKAVMGFPQSHKVSEGIQGYQQLGNAVIPQMIRLVYESIQM